MELTGALFLGLMVICALTAPVVTVLSWERARGGRALRLAQRLAMVAWCQITAVTLTAVLVNNQFDLYESWSDLFGSDGAQQAAVGPGPGGATSAGATAAGSESWHRDGRVLNAEVRGARSRITAKLWVLTPPGYDDPANASTRYPVVMFLPGYPGTPTTWLHALDLQRVMDAEVAAHRVRPFIAVLPTMNVATPRDTECADVPSGPQVATWLGVDVPDIVQARTRAMPPGTAWGVSGYSTGGFCAAKLLLTYPHRFTSAAVLAGYFTPSVDVTTGDLYGGSTELRHDNDPQWLVTHRPQPAARILVVWSAQDPETAAPSRAFLAALRSPMKAEQVRLSKGGHNTSVWLGALPRVLDWLGGVAET